MSGKGKIGNDGVSSATDLQLAVRRVTESLDAMREEFGFPSASDSGQKAPAEVHPRMAGADRSNSMALGIQEVDRQHKELLVLANKLLDHPGADIRAEEITGLLSQLGRALAAHFDTEEALMHASAAGPEATMARVAAHGRILDQYVDINLAAAAGQNYTAEELFRTVRRWILDH